MPLSRARVGVMCVLALSTCTALLFYGHAQKAVVMSLERYVLPQSQTPSFLRARVDRYWVEASHEPFFSMTAVDLEDYREALPLLKESARVLAKNYPREEAENIEENLYPVDFLSQLEVAEEKRRTFISNPSLIRAVGYHRKLVMVFDSYEESLARFRSQLEHQSSTNIAFVHGYSNAQYLAARLQEVEKALRDTRAREAQRFACLINLFSRCTSPVVTPSETKPRVVATPTVSPNARDLEYASLIRALGDVRGPPISLTAAEKEETEPLYALQHPTCTAREATTTFVARWGYTSPAELPALRALPTNVLYFWDSSKRGGTLAAFLTTHGARYVYQPLNPYMCIDSGAELSRIASSMYVRESLEKEPLARQAPTTVTEQLANLERHIVESRTVSDEDIEGYFFEAERLVGTYGEHALQKDIGGGALQRLTHLRSAWRDQSAYWPNLIVDIARLAPYVGMTSNGTQPILEYAFVVRSMPSLTYLTSNRSVVPQPFLLTEKVSDNPLRTDHLTEYAAIRAQIPPSELPAYVATGEQLIEEFNR